VRNCGPSNTVQSEIVKWTKPIVGRFKCNVNVVLGACIRDAKGNFVIAKTEWITPIIDVDMGEAICLLFAIQWARELSMMNIDLETGSKAVLPPSHNNSLFSIFSFSQKNCHFRIPMQHLLFFPIIIPLFIEFHPT